MNIKFNLHIPKDFEKASIFQQLDFCLIYILGKIVIHLIKILVGILKFTNQKNELSSTSIDKLENQIKKLRIGIRWTMDYVQLSNQNKDTSALHEFRKNLEKQFNEDPENENE